MTAKVAQIQRIAKFRLPRWGRRAMNLVTQNNNMELFTPSLMAKDVTVLWQDPFPITRKTALAPLSALQPATHCGQYCP